ncbi:hypothetical protein Q3G72_023940 [Acer saccharum]|nr:hypothetical protein Q3G72_023940 [Acer saccharum]
MLKIWAEDPKERASEVKITCGHLVSPCGRPWAPRAREPSAPVGPTRPPRGGDVAAHDSLIIALHKVEVSCKVSEALCRARES